MPFKGGKKRKERKKLESGIFLVIYLLFLSQLTVVCTKSGTGLIWGMASRAMNRTMECVFFKPFRFWTFVPLIMAVQEFMQWASWVTWLS